jgi:hypothetical protein
MQLGSATGARADHIARSFGDRRGGSSGDCYADPADRD